jgi:hypothetical protein
MLRAFFDFGSSYFRKSCRVVSKGQVEIGYLFYKLLY